MDVSETTIIEELESLKQSSEKLIGVNERFFAKRDHGAKMNHYELCNQVDEIIEEYNWIIPEINNLMKEIEFKIILEPIGKVNKDWGDLTQKIPVFSTLDDILRKISLKCGRIISILKNLATKTLETKNKFEGIKKEIDELKKLIPSETYDNLKEALGEFESNHLLATALICGRICVYNLDLIQGNINEKIEKMKKEGILKSRGASEMILRAEKKIRDLFSHDLKYFPTASVVLSIFGDTINVVEKITEYKEKIKNPEQ